MKTEWTKPQLEVLDVNQTMANDQVGTRLDASWQAGTAYDDLTWSS
ncbi:paeninodin family lasso peptide [Aquibacillus rhizosphaerae]|uniref:Paeninodin family lasso peptide n=1 Tax=Aquibacillus rhizosphaerae TaxID=3051431 RepID=A0ABT7KZK3_9BACI|nr:paeninodin family lasso peptide [Aquibacillus sp. LR5S19]MDL4838974.1 paeninodin family lasso peptide [Aquibacillus sp. LR5S19]